MGEIQNGVAKIEVSLLDNNGQPTTWQILGDTEIDSANVATEGGTTNDFFSEEKDKPVFTRKTKGKPVLNFAIIDPVLDTYKFIFGGVITGTGAAAEWTEPEVIIDPEVAIRITPDYGRVITYPRVILSGAWDATLSKNNLATLPVTGDILAPRTIGAKVSAAGSTGPQLPQTITFDSQANLAVAAQRILPVASSSGLTITYQSTNPSVVSVNGSVITGVSAGTAQIIATQLGNSSYAPATPVVQDITIT